MLFHYLKHLRDFFYTRVVWRRYKFGPGFHCGRNTFIWGKSTIEVGRNFYMGRGSSIETDCVIGDNVIMANNVAIVGRYDHNYQQIGVAVRNAEQIRDCHYSGESSRQVTVIGDDVWIGYGVIVLSGVKISSGTIVAAGSVVTRDTEPYCIYAGNPARKLKARFDNEFDLQKHTELLKKKQADTL